MVHSQEDFTFLLQVLVAACNDRTTDLANSNVAGKAGLGPAFCQTVLVEGLQGMLAPVDPTLRQGWRPRDRMMRRVSGLPNKRHGTCNGVPLQTTVLFKELLSRFQVGLGECMVLQILRACVA